MIRTDDLRIGAIKNLMSPSELLSEIPASDAISQTVADGRTAIQNVLQQKDDRLLVVVGPCSIHDPDSARQYAEKLAVEQKKHADELLIVMRVYFEKPRTTVGWKGLINDPKLDDSFEINHGLRTARRLLSDINAMGLPTGTEFLDLISPQYVADLVGWGAIGARTTESQGHRELASGLSCPVGFKNGTSGNVQIAVDAICSARRPHHFLSVTKEGTSAIFATTGNPDCHIILRGGKHTNYDAASIDMASGLLEKADLPARIMIDCSHANSRKIFKRQSYVCRDICAQVSDGDQRIMGVMIESNLLEGNQKLSDSPLVQGLSVTDACIGWETTEQLFSDLGKSVAARRKVG
ncbi:3-deoxy-7-phosphoheptulonate synthase [Rhodopirellula baltica]|uniref:Phospho-2-dehydro-3-deoxyheptonate aldolase n=3 Tax=Rhodopirellula baltica TaxID=265606 RepID=Q7UII4_RHOBA|nr:3-deoxy-7-phosphoheptulonate synthase [Rhodopirellula baltica]EGF29561.1 phospho-2-dehydro-3-deoxyheptonate aldolase [Rhodopirellula baltica WH47]ELP30609.1 phospho-2-dehydro-3-deoxyheptonate aldolase [Rhodopirellula baltica SWK14]CAD77630.1 phospho-2-dehydro-3-deoxyheptonate aldolase [Rhodopirellula baltica SH 1]HBE62296.1 3-deoxy-7-phosphoheptulonate synthase [Rhodopirellula baltica]